MAIKEVSQLFEYNQVDYHGHLRERISQIMTRGTFESSQSDNDWLGTGIYFFERDLSQAINWCVRARKYKSWAVLEANIKTNRLLDLTIDEHFDKFNDLARMIQKRYEKIATGEDLTRKKIFDFVYELVPYDVVRHTFEVPSGGMIPYTNISRMQVQVCVRNPDSIINIKEVEI